jgi:phosphatidylinositol-3-phosphatase
MPNFRLSAAFLTAFLAILPAQTTRADDSGDGRSFQHVFVIVLENEGYNTTFGPGSKAPYLSQTLTKQGVLLSQYYGTGHASLDNSIAMISGQAATPETRSDCQKYQDFTLTGLTPDGQAIGSGCVYPASIKTLPDQLNAIGKTWRAYMGDMGNDPSRESATAGTLCSTQRTSLRPRNFPRHPCRKATNTRRVTIRSCISIRSSIRRTAKPTWSTLIS